jgi:hypothetical protein
MSPGIIPDNERGALWSVQKEAVEALKAHPFFSDITILQEDQQDIEFEINKALGGLPDAGGKSGICLIVMLGPARALHPNVEGPYFDDASIVVRIIETVLVNRGENGTCKPVSLVAEHVAAALHQRRVPGIHEMLYTTAITPQSDPNALVWDVAFKTQFGLGAIQP